MPTGITQLISYSDLTMWGTFFPLQWKIWISHNNLVEQDLDTETPNFKSATLNTHQRIVINVNYFKLDVECTPTSLWSPYARILAEGTPRSILETSSNSKRVHGVNLKMIQCHAACHARK